MTSIIFSPKRLFSAPAPSKVAFLSIFLFAFGSFSSCSAGKGDGGKTDNVTISGTLQNCGGDSIRLYQVIGPVSEQIAAGKLVTEGGQTTFTISSKLPEAGLYTLGLDPRKSASFLLGDQTELTLTGNCSNPAQTFQLTGSSLNDGYKDLMQTVTLHNQRVQQLQQNIQIFQQSDPSQIGRLQQEIQAENTTYFAQLDSFLNREDLVAKYASLYNFRPFGSDPTHTTQYANDLEYFKEGFFSNLDFTDQDIAKAPQLFDKAQFYGGTLAAYIQPADAKSSFDKVLADAKPGSLSHQNILKGFLTGLEQRKSDLYVDYGTLFVEQYPNDQISATVTARMNQMKALMVGNVAPNISSPTPQGGSVALEDLRGKVVMIDFWASWCRPCRMENPNVVKAYNKYKGAGFEILGVSLDNNKQKWVDAIAKDGLTWPHISDLGGWGSQPAAAYGVSSIPATYLLDREGKIIAKNLRGPALESKLAEIFGY